MKLLELDFVQQHLHRYGVGPYLPLASERLSQDIQGVMDQLNCTQEEAVAYLSGRPVSELRAVKPKTDGQ